MVVVGNFRNRAELRKKPRRQFHYIAKVIIDENGTALACSIADISETGARIVFESDATVPERFVLLLNATGEARRHCHVVWRSGATVGVTFPQTNR
jgi:methyl-accepting chemotaxis protein